MEKRRKNFLITTEKHEVTIIRAGKPVGGRAFCPSCGEEVDIVTFDNAAALMAADGRELPGQIESGAIHSVHVSGGFGVCKRSLEEEK